MIVTSSNEVCFTKKVLQIECPQTNQSESLRALSFCLSGCLVQAYGIQFKSTWPNQGPESVTPQTLDHVETLATQGQTESHAFRWCNLRR